MQTHPRPITEKMHHPSMFLQNHTTVQLWPFKPLFHFFQIPFSPISAIFKMLEDGAMAHNSSHFRETHPNRYPILLSKTHFVFHVPKVCRFLSVSASPIGSLPGCHFVLPVPSKTHVLAHKCIHTYTQSTASQGDHLL